MTIRYAMKVKLQFSTGSPIILRERDLIEKIPVLVNYIKKKYPNWEQQNVRIKEPMLVPFPADAGFFLLEHLCEWIPPTQREGRTILQHYPEALRKTFAELKTVQSLAEFLQCADFRECIVFVRSKYFQYPTWAGYNGPTTGYNGPDPSNAFNSAYMSMFLGARRGSQTPPGQIPAQPLQQ